MKTSPPNPQCRFGRPLDQTTLSKIPKVLFGDGHLLLCLLVADHDQGHQMFNSSTTHKLDGDVLITEEREIVCILVVFGYIS